MTILNNPNPSSIDDRNEALIVEKNECLKKEGLMIHLHFNNLQFLL